ncbi:MAG: PQQ-binding-like beta-propeller repeat protein [Phycisphaera sp.]|nr:PQQ-binding-like beta-propeller repeat protein [Phycisphaera sp.]
MNRIPHMMKIVATLAAVTVMVIGGCASPEPIQQTTVKASAPVTGEWPQWRGPTRDGRVADSPVWPTSIDEQHLKLLWRTQVGPAYSSPVVTADTVFTTESRDGGEIVRAIDRRTGKQRWQQRWAGEMSQPFYGSAFGMRSYIRSTPAWDGQRLYVGGMRDVLVCLDGATGKVVWRFDMVAEYGTPLPTWGLVCSPLIDSGFVYVQGGGGFVKVDKATGKPVWRTLVDGGGLGKATFSSPVLATIAGRNQLLVQMRDALHGVDPASGKVLWSQPIKAAEGQNILTPTAFGDGVFTSAKGGRSLLLKITPSGDTCTAEQAWDTNKVGYLASPIVIDGNAYLHLSSSRLACIDLKTGEVKWVSSERFGDYLSMASQGDKILALSNDGELYLIHANPKQLDLLGQRHVSNDKTWSHVAPVGHNVYVRELNAIAAYEWTN